MTWAEGLKLLVVAAESLSALARAVNTARETGKEVDLEPFRARDDAVSRAVVAESDRQKAERDAG